MTLRPEYLAIAQQALRSRRRALASSSPQAFAGVYLAPLFNKPFSPMH